MSEESEESVTVPISTIEMFSESAAHKLRQEVGEWRERAGATLTRAEQAEARLKGPLLDLIKRELVQRGYEEVEPGGGGVWTHPEWDATDHIFPAIQDCFEREADEG